LDIERPQAAEATFRAFSALTSNLPGQASTNGEVEMVHLKTRSLKPRVWIFEDETSWRDRLTSTLQHIGCEVVAFSTPPDFRAALKSGSFRSPNCVVLDIQVAGKDVGLELCKAVNTQLPEIPVFFLTNHPHGSRGHYAASGYAAQYHSKGISDALLLLAKQIRAQMAVRDLPTEWDAGAVHMDTKKRRVEWHNKAVFLEGVLFPIVEYLTRNADVVLTYEEISTGAGIAELADEDFETTPNMQDRERNRINLIHAHIARIRRRFQVVENDTAAAAGRSPVDFKHVIVNLPKVGYRWNPSTEEYGHR